MSNFTGSNDDATANGSNGSGGNAGNGGMPPGFPPVGATPGNMASDEDAALEMLVDYNERFKTAGATLFRDEVIEQTLSILIGKTKPNALLIGPAGVGKTRIVEDIARRIALKDPLIPDQLKDHTIYELPLSNIVAGSGIVGDLEAKTKSIIDFATDPKKKVIIFIDEVHQLTNSPGGSDTYSKITQILKPAMARGDMQVIGATTTQEGRSLEDDPAFKRRFTRLIVDELTPEQTVVVLGKARPEFVSHYKHKLSVSDSVLEEIVRIADESTGNTGHRPDNALTLLDRSMADLLLNQQKLAATMPVGSLAMPAVPLTLARVTNVAKRLRTGNSQSPDFDAEVTMAKLKSSILGQGDIIDKLVDRLDRETLNVFPRTVPMAWMFAGASGVGKTESAKIIAQQLTGQEPIILNMTEFHQEHAMSRIIGAPPGYVGSNSNAELPFDSLESNPHRVVLLDEFEKADKAIQRLFLQALDEGYITTARGKIVDFSKALVIATTNAARDALENKQMGFTSGAPAPISNRTLNSALAQFFDTELLGRFSLIVGFHQIDGKGFNQILEAQYAVQRELIVTRDAKMDAVLPKIIPSDEVLAMSEQYFVPNQGARPAARAVRSWIEDHLITHRQNQLAIQAAQVAQTLAACNAPAEPDGEIQGPTDQY